MGRAVAASRRRTQRGSRLGVNRYRVQRAAIPAMSAMPRKRKKALQVNGDAHDVISSQQPGIVSSLRAVERLKGGTVPRQEI